MGNNYIEKNVNLAKISLYCAHRSGYYVRMHTDSKGFEYLKDIGYDDIVLDLDTIPDDIPTSVFAYSKYIALKNESLGVIHTDFDVFIKHPCLNIFYEDKSYDCILLCIENTKLIQSDFGYVSGRQKFQSIKTPKWFPFMWKESSNVGVIGFNNKTLKNLYLNLYQKCVNFYKEYSDLNVPIPDLFFELVNINYLINRYKFNVFYILPEGTYWEIHTQIHAKQIGYLHLMGSWKYKPEGQAKIKEISDELFKYKNSNLRKIWSAPCTGKSELALKSDKYIDFDLLKDAEGINYFSTEYNEYIKKLFKLFNDTCEKYHNSGKILLLSDTELLRAFYHDFDEIYYLDIPVMKLRIVDRDKDKESNVDIWCLEIEEDLEFIKNKKSITKITCYLSDILEK